MLKEIKKPYLIAEIGINHNGSLESAKKLIDATNACNWNCAKFQKRNPDVCVPEHQKKVPRETPWGAMTYLEYKRRIEFEKKEYDYINSYCQDKSLDWSVSVWDIDSYRFTESYDIKFIKIPSAHITNLTLIDEVSKSNQSIILSTGMSTWQMIDDAVEILEKNNSDYALLHCNSTYPAPHDELNLMVIPEMKQRYNCPIGYSGHEYDLEPTVIAVALGAIIIERHITLDHKMWGTDHKSSLEVSAMDLLKRRVENVSNILGESKKYITNSELDVIKKLRPD
jgi:N-acetylneuraminate synthase